MVLQNNYYKNPLVSFCKCMLNGTIGHTYDSQPETIYERGAN